MAPETTQNALTPTSSSAPYRRLATAVAALTLTGVLAAYGTRRPAPASPHPGPVTSCSSTAGPPTSRRQWRDHDLDSADIANPKGKRVPSRTASPHNGVAVHLTDDGPLPTQGTIAPWQEAADWQQPGPAIKVVGDRAYLTDAATKQVVIIDLLAGAEVKRIPLDVTPMELAVVSGYAEAPSRTTTTDHHRLPATRVSRTCRMPSGRLGMSSSRAGGLGGWAETDSGLGREPDPEVGQVVGHDQVVPGDVGLALDRHRVAEDPHQHDVGLVQGEVFARTGVVPRTEGEP